MKQTSLPKRVNGFAPILILFLIIALAAIGYFSYKSNISQNVQPPGTSPSDSTTSPSTTNWNKTDFSKSISFKLPTTVAVPKFVNSGHYALETNLPGNTTFQIWGADGASPSGGQDYFSTNKKTIESNKNLTIKEIGFVGYEAIEFSGNNIAGTSNIVKGGENAIKLRGVLAKMADSRALMILHYQAETLQKDGDFSADEKVLDQILSTFKFTEEESKASPKTENIITIPADWKSYTDSDFEFKTKVTLSLPPGYSFRFSGSEWTIQNENAGEVWDYRNSMFSGDSGLKNYYDGSSRRSWYQRFLNDEFSANTIKSQQAQITNVVEHFFNKTSYLEVTTKNISGETEKSYIFVENGLMHIIKSASQSAKSSTLVDSMDKVFASLNSQIIE